MRHQKAFTILELAVVITIIALILGGVMLANSLIRTAEINGVVSDFARYSQAVVNFKDKYSALPGDMKGAELLWGTDPAGCPGTFTTTPHIATCDGNGDGEIAYSSAGGWANASESGRAWQQLADAGFITGGYSGISGTGGGSVFVALPGINVPASQLPGGGYTLWYENDPGATYNLLGHQLLFGAAAPNSYTTQPILSASEAYGIDVKMDDGLPATGTIITMAHAALSSCTTADDSSYAQTTDSTPACVLYYHLGF